MKKLPKFYAMGMKVSNNMYLFVMSCEIKYATYIVEVIKAHGEGGSFLSWHHFNAEAIISCEQREQRIKNRS
jgi:hypothetical protein